MIYLRLFYEFAKAGLFAIGGGLATLPFLQDISASTGWYTLDELANMIAISESTPGPIGVNMATYVGYSTCSELYGPIMGVFGAIVATLGLIFPSVVIIIIIAGILKKFQDNKFVKAAFYGLRPASAGLIGAACFSVALLALFNTDLFKETKVITDLFNWKGIILAVVLFFVMKLKPLKKLHPAVFLLAAAVIGVVFNMGV